MTETVRAAGGVVWRTEPDGRLEVAVIHRPRYDDWSFPKGKVRDGEDELHAALREVEEETGHRCVSGRDLGTIEYRDRQGRRKTVRYWSMVPVEGGFTPGPEVDELRWLPLRRAIQMLTYDHDRGLLANLREG
jgi:8-oxo-dGTP diphosphatase